MIFLTLSVVCRIFIPKVSEYYQEIITITQHRPTQGTMRKSHRTFTVTRHPKDNKSKTASSLFLFKMIAKLERTQSNAQQNRDKHRTPRPSGSTPNNGSKTTERTAA